MDTIRIGSRGSQLALWQANFIADELRRAGNTVEIEVIRTTGDRMQTPGFVLPAGPNGEKPDGKGIFIKEIEEALAAGRIDLAVHSLKDLPTTMDARFTMAAIPPRADARDAFVCEAYWGLHMLPEWARIGTTSPRRRAQLLALRPDLEFVEMRGNIDTRLRKLEEGECDALVLACAGLDRIGRTESVHQRFGVDELTPAPGQGALGLETRSPLHAVDVERDAAIFAAVRALECRETRFAVEAERAFLNGMGGGCDLPLGAYCQARAGGWEIRAQVLARDGEQSVEVTLRTEAGEDAVALGTRAAERVKDAGGLDLLDEELVR